MSRDRDYLRNGLLTQMNREGATWPRPRISPKSWRNQSQQKKKSICAMSTWSVWAWLGNVELARKSGLLQRPRAGKMPRAKRVGGQRHQKRSSTASRRSQRIRNLGLASTSSARQQAPAPLGTAPRGGKRSSFPNRPVGTSVTSTDMPTSTGTATLLEQLASAGIREVPSPPKLDTLPDDVHDLFLAVKSIANMATPIIPAAVIVCPPPSLCPALPGLRAMSFLSHLTRS